MKKLAAVLLLSGCVSTTHEMLPDGSWQVTADSGAANSAASAEIEFNERVGILCPQGVNLISKSPVLLAGRHGIVGRFTCAGEQPTTKAH